MLKQTEKDLLVIRVIPLRLTDKEQLLNVAEEQLVHVLPVEASSGPTLNSVIIRLYYTSQSGQAQRLVSLRRKERSAFTVTVHPEPVFEHFNVSKSSPIKL